MLTNNKILLSAGDASGNLTSSPEQLTNMIGFAIQAVITGTPVGIIKLQGSCDAGTVGANSPPIGTGVTNWNDIADSSQAVSAAGIIDWNYNGAFFKWVRVVYTSTSGTGNITVTINTKGA